MNPAIENPKDAVGSKKSPLSALPWRVLHRVGLAFLEGSLKYGRHNYRVAGVRASVYFDAIVARHISAWWEGEDIDADSNEHHLDKAMAALMVLRDSQLEGNWIDDRPPRGNIDFADLNARTAALIERYGDRNPRHYTIKDTSAANEPVVLRPGVISIATTASHDTAGNPLQNDSRLCETPGGPLVMHG